MNRLNHYFDGLTAFIESAFPKKCTVCGKTYQTAEQFLTETQNMPNGRSSLKQALEEDGTAIVEVFRNCRCGSTLMDEFNSRRDNTNPGQEKRAEFDKLVLILQNQHVPVEIARIEILKLFKGEKSETLDYLLKNATHADHYD